MKKLVKSLLLASVCAAASSAAVAEDGAMKIIPVELYTCSYVDGKGQSDLDKVIEGWNKWMDEAGTDSYSAWTLTPHYFGPDQDFDVIWLGASKNAVAMHQGQAAWLNEDAGLRQAFADVVSCDAHVNFASFNFKAPPKGETPSNSVLTFSDCNFHEGATFEALVEASGKWSKHLSDNNSNVAIFHWYPAFGGGKETFDFKWLQAHKDLTELGTYYEFYANGGGWQANMELFGGIVDCDASRAYIAKNHRYAQIR